MSNIMPLRQITIWIPERLIERLKKHAQIRRRSRSAVVCEALENYLASARTSRSAYELAKETGLIGCVRDAPSDLSTRLCALDE
jgi:metal-responsive CopG/Arc/MetJ family transcriptional regulator